MGAYKITLIAGLGLALLLGSITAYKAFGPGAWHPIRNDQGEIREIVRTDQGIELRIECIDVHLQSSRSVPFAQGATLPADDLPVHMGYWDCSEYSCYMRNGKLDDLIAAVDRQQFTYIFRNDTQTTITYDFQSVRPMLSQLRAACEASWRR